jgi:hypothetical protein
MTKRVEQRENERDENEIFQTGKTVCFLSGTTDQSLSLIHGPHLRFARRRQAFVALAVFLRVAVIDGVLVIVDLVAQLIAFDFKRAIDGRSRGRASRRLVGRALMRQRQRWK